MITLTKNGVTHDVDESLVDHFLDSGWQEVEIVEIPETPEEPTEQTPEEPKKKAKKQERLCLSKFV